MRVYQRIVIDGASKKFLVRARSFEDAKQNALRLALARHGLDVLEV